MILSSVVLSQYIRVTDRQHADDCQKADDRQTDRQRLITIAELLQCNCNVPLITSIQWTVACIKQITT